MGNINFSAVVARNAADIMAMKGLTQSNVATEGLSQKTVSNILAGASDSETRPASMTLKTLEKLATGLGVEPWKLLADFTPEKRRAWDAFEAAFNAMQCNATAPTLAITNHKPVKANGGEK